MPTAWDYPGRVPKADKDPLANLLNFNDIDVAAEKAGQVIRDGLINTIKLLTGIDITSWVAFLEDLAARIGFDLSAFGDLNPVTFLTNVKAFLDDIDFADPDFDPLAMVAQFIQNKLGPLGVIRQQDILSEGDVPTLPYALPFTLPVPATPWARWFTNLRRFLTLIDFSATDFDPLASLRQFVENGLQPTNMLAWLEDLGGGEYGLPLAQLPEGLYDLFRQIIELITPDVAIPSTPGGFFAQAWNTFASWFGITNTTKATATTALSQATANAGAINAVVNPGAVSISDLMDYAVAETLPYDLDYTESGGGAIMALGDGKVGWSPSGNLARTGWARHPDETATIYQEITVVIDKTLAEGLSSTPRLYLRGRVETDNDEDVHVRIEHDSAQLGRRDSSGTVIAVGSAVDFTPNDGDSLTWIVGTTADDREVIFKRNGVTVIPATVIAGANVTNLGVGFALRASNGPNSTQALPAVLDSFHATDRSV